jgi:hypothetical protein
LRPQKVAAAPNRFATASAITVICPCFRYSHGVSSPYWDRHENDRDDPSFELLDEQSKRRIALNTPLDQPVGMNHGAVIAVEMRAPINLNGAPVIFRDRNIDNCRTKAILCSRLLDCRSATGSRKSVAISPLMTTRRPSV